MIANIMKVGVTNCYLLKADEGYVLVDTGYDREWDAFRRELARVGVGFSDLRYLILTHHHDDHAGLLNQLVAQNPRIKIVMSERARDPLAKGRNDWSKGGGYINRRINALIALMRLFGKWTQTFPPYMTREDDILVTEEAGLRELGIGLDGKIVKTTGHSPDCISVALPDGDWLVGDAAANMPGIAGTKYCVPLVEDLDQYYRTWTKILEAGARQILPAHGAPFPADELRRHIGRNKKSDMVPFR
jgi:glyoxylase-like metal-dependent hydrolase (beta-lactamase superfamily II)